MRAAVLLAAALLTACGQLGEGNPRICGSIAPRIQGPTSTAEEQRKLMVSCIDHWSRRLAKSPQDSAQDVADAVFGACQDAVELYVSMAERAKQPTQGVEAVWTYWRRHVLFVVVQTRAGDCPLPEA